MSAEKKKEKKQKSLARRIIIRIILCLLLLFFLSVAVAGIWFYNKYGKQLQELREYAMIIASKSTEEDFRAEENTVCYYSDGTVMSVLKGEKDVYYLKTGVIPQNVEKAFLAVEDRKFYDHKGYDIYAIARAAKAYIKNEGEIKQGGSTITQQLARTIYLTNEKTIERKVTEIFLASELEKKYSKEQILEFYINNIYFANGYYGIQAASEGYFGKTADELSLSETAFLCGIPNSPSDYNPKKRFENALERRDSVLKQMRENGYISGQEYQEALEEKIELSTSVRTIADYAETFTYYCASRALMLKNGFIFRNEFLDEEDREGYEELYEDEYFRMKRSLFTKGYRIYTSLNPEKQKLLQKTIDDTLADYDEVNDEGVYALQASGVCIDNETGFVVSIIGGRENDLVGYTLNRAFQSPRQPGSSIKPLVVYTPAFENGYYPDTMVLDEKFEGGPRNSSGVYSGEIELRYAVAMSKNTVAWKIFSELTPKKGLSYLKKMGFSHLVETDYVPAASLGGLTYGATALEMTSAYSALENGGTFRTPTCILRITDADGHPVIDNTDSIARAANYARSGVSLAAGGGICCAGETRVYQRNAALMMTDVLKTVMLSGTGRKLALEGMTSAGKTGTTNEQKDGWFVGFTKYYTTGIWVGYDYPRELEELMGNTYPGRIWKEYMDKIHENLKDFDFEAYIDPRPAPEEDTETGEAGDEEDDVNSLFHIDSTENDGETGPEFSGSLLYAGENGEIILLVDGYDDEAPFDREGKPAYYDDDGNRIFYDEDGNEIIVAADGYPENYLLPGEWILYDAKGNPVMAKMK